MKKTERNDNYGRNLLECLDSACNYLDILEKEEEEDKS